MGVDMNGLGSSKEAPAPCRAGCFPFPCPALTVPLPPARPPRCRLRQEQEQRAAKFSMLHATFAKKEAGLREAAEAAEAEAARARAQALELAGEVAAAQRCAARCVRAQAAAERLPHNGMVPCWWGGQCHSIAGLAQQLAFVRAVGAQRDMHALAPFPGARRRQRRP